MNNKTSFALRVLKDRCTGCGLCADSCAFNAIRLVEYPEIDPYTCRLCGTCVQTCLAEALQIDTPDSASFSPKKSEGIWVLAETEGGMLASVTKELLGEAVALSEKLRCNVEAVLPGSGVAVLADELIAYGADRVHVLEHSSLASFIEENYARVVVALAGRYNPDILLVGATERGRGLAARVASMLHTGLTADCTQLEIDPESGLLHQIRPAFGGNLMAAIVTPNCRPQMASVRPGVMKAAEPDRSRKGEIVCHDLSDFEPDHRICLMDEMAANVCGDTLENSRIVIGVGRGVKNKETVVRIRQWAEQIGAVVAGSRAAVEMGLIDAHLQVGQTGHTILRICI